MGTLGIVLVVAFLVGIPIAFALGLASLAFLLKSDIPLILIAQRMYTGVDFFPLVAVPLFVFAGFLMETGGISRRIVDLALSIVGPMRGSLGMGAVVSEMIFSGISGSSIADASAMGAILIPTMGKAGYDAKDSTSIIAAATGMGILVPPCMAMVVLRRDGADLDRCISLPQVFCPLPSWPLPSASSFSSKRGRDAYQETAIPSL